MSLRSCFLLFFLFTISGCAGLPEDGNRATPPKFEKILVQGDEFLITTFQKITDPSAPYVFYIEGDGLAFLGKRQVSSNPTPKNLMLINLASMDERPNIVYIARPCQFTKMELNPKCTPLYWTTKRLSEDSVASINSVINKINSRGKKFSLIGFSGGGGIAVLIAARNHNVRDIITISGNLDLAAFNQFHNVPPMTLSLDPINYARFINHVPQLHLSGSDDKIVPSFLAANYVKESNSTCVRQKIFPGVSHKKGWDKIWRSVYSHPLTCHETSN